MKYTEDGALLAVASSGGQIYVHNAKDHYSLEATTCEYRQYLALGFFNKWKL